MRLLHGLATSLMVSLPTPAFAQSSQAPADGEPKLATQAGVGYRFRNHRLSQAGSGLEGWADNELKLSGQVRTGSWLYGGEVWRFRAPATMPGLRPDQNPVMTPEITDFRLRVGHVVRGKFWEVAPSLGFLQQNVTPNNQGVPYSGTLMDWTHVRRGLGLAVPIALSLPGPWEIGGTLTAIPWTDIRLDRAPGGVGASGFAEVRMALGHALPGDLAAEVSYTRTWWRGGFDEDADVYGVGIRYRPAAR